jgi:hypothetical protein
MELEFRNKDGIHLFTLTGKMADMTYKYIATLPELVYGIRSIGSKTKPFEKYQVFECIRLCGYTLFNGISFTMNEGDYIKIV